MEPITDERGSSTVTKLLWLLAAVMLVVFVVQMRHVLTTDPRARGIPPPSDLYENIGSVDDYPLGATHLRGRIWILMSEHRFVPVLEDPACRFSFEGDRLVDCHGQVHAVQGDPRDYLVGPDSADPETLCAIVYPPAGDLWVYFEPRPETGGCP
jgi:hypothetical protein